MRVFITLLLLLCLPALHGLTAYFLVHPNLTAAGAPAVKALTGDAPLVVAGRTLRRDVCTELSPTAADSLVVHALRSLGCTCAAPTDYRRYLRFNRAPALNISTPWATGATILQDDSLRVAVATVYTPDFPVRCALGPQARFSYDVAAVLRDSLAPLHRRADAVVLLTDLPRHVLEALLPGLPVNAVVSFDYMPSASEPIGGIPCHFPGKTTLLRLEAHGPATAPRLTWTTEKLP